MRSTALGRALGWLVVVEWFGVRRKIVRYWGSSLAEDRARDSAPKFALAAGNESEVDDNDDNADGYDRNDYNGGLYVFDQKLIMAF
ncbi:unnamed protein product [Litomosoides sigmodontis]|uniref:Uncharacterized protein n=1 Tax=Litomosoides sigmodontis TaxID=42156 RepID=A0A3P6VAC0_LITSI|nr:unnamed protein product [Litomosoides sigmodontis]